MDRNTHRNSHKHNLPFMKSIDVTPGQKEEIHFLSQDLARKLIVPQKGKKQFRGIINYEKLQQLQKHAGRIVEGEEVTTKEDKIKRRERLQKEQEERKAEFEAWDAVRKKNVKLTDLEEDAKQQMEYLREKANEMIREQNEEIKEMNKLILSAKVQAIRDAQVNEKKEIKKKLNELDTGSDEVMEQKWKEGVLKDKEMAQKRKETSQQAAQKLQEQIMENNERKLIEEERKIKEGEVLLRKLKEDQMRDYQEMKTRQLKKKVFLKELAKENEESKRRKQIVKDQSEKEDKIISEYQRLKALQEEAKFEAEKEAKLKRELELAKLGEQHGRAADIQAEQEALRGRRAQEEKEREYRKKEKEKALKKKKMFENLKKSLAEQVEEQEKIKHLKAAKDIEELEALLKKIKEENKTGERKELFKKLDNLKHLDELKDQIKKKETEKMNEKKEFYWEGIHLRQEEKRREEMLNVLKKEKLNELQKYNIPETYIKHIKRKAHIEEFNGIKK